MSRQKKQPKHKEKKNHLKKLPMSHEKKKTRDSFMLKNLYEA